jgi:hypothetical protein
MMNLVFIKDKRQKPARTTDVVQSGGYKDKSFLPSSFAKATDDKKRPHDRQPSPRLRLAKQDYLIL